MLIISYPVPTNVKGVCLSSFYFLSSPRDFPALLSPTLFIYYQWVSRPPAKPPSSGACAQSLETSQPHNGRQFGSHKHVTIVPSVRGFFYRHSSRRWQSKMEDWGDLGAFTVQFCLVYFKQNPCFQFNMNLLNEHLCSGHSAGPQGLKDEERNGARAQAAYIPWKKIGQGHVWPQWSSSTTEIRGKADGPRGRREGRGWLKQEGMRMGSSKWGRSRSKGWRGTSPWFTLAQALDVQKVPLRALVKRWPQWVVAATRSSASVLSYPGLCFCNFISVSNVCVESKLSLWNSSSWWHDSFP